MISDDANFDNFGNAFLTLFRAATADGWYMVMNGAMIEPPLCSGTKDNPGEDCGVWWGSIFFFIFMLFGSIIMLNLYIAIILDNWEESYNASERDETYRLLNEFAEKWTVHDPDAGKAIPCSEFQDSISLIAPPIGLGRKENASLPRDSLLRQLKLMNIPIFPLENMMKTDAPRRKRSRSSSENDSNKSGSSKQETYETGKEGKEGEEGKETDEEPADLERGTKRLVMKRLSRRNSKAALLLKNAEEAANVRIIFALQILGEVPTPNVIEKYKDLLGDATISSTCKGCVAYILEDMLKKTRSIEYELVEAFKIFDTADNGWLPRETVLILLGDLCEHLTLHEIDTAINAVDQDGDGMIEFSEFVDLLNAKSVLSPVTTGDLSDTERRDLMLEKFDKNLQVTNWWCLWEDSIMQIVENIGNIKLKGDDHHLLVARAAPRKRPRRIYRLHEWYAAATIERLIILWFLRQGMDVAAIRRVEQRAKDIERGELKAKVMQRKTGFKQKQVNVGVRRQSISQNAPLA
eukprot:g4127.t1